jgi:hypothetical protein
VPRSPLSRRTLLRGVLRGGLVSIALPPLEIFFNASGTALACGGAIPTRFGIFFWGNGMLPDRWIPSGEGEDWQLSDELAPLAPIKDVVSVVSGLSVKIPNVEPHWSGLTGLLTGMEPLPEDSSEPQGPTLDQLIADLIGGSTLYRSLQTAAHDGVSGVSFNGPYSRNPPETDPYAFYERLFGDTFREPGEEGEVDPSWGLRRSALDAVMGDISALKLRLGASDIARLDQHLDGIRDIEQRLATLEDDPPNLESCARPDAPQGDYSDVDSRPKLPERNAIMADLMAMALACDQTRVFGHYLTDPVDDVLFEGASAGHHDLTHNEADPQDEVHAITVQCVQHFAEYIERLRAIPEGDGTLLDNCAVLGTSEISQGQTHSLDEMPILIAGSACGALRQGVHYRSYTQENASKAMLSLLRVFDISAESFGVDEAWTDESLSAIEL